MREAGTGCILRQLLTEVKPSIVKLMDNTMVLYQNYMKDQLALLFILHGPESLQPSL